MSHSVAVLPESQVWVTAVSRRNGYNSVQQLSLGYNQRQLALANRVVWVNPDVHFKVMVANVGKITQTLVRNQVLGSVLPQMRLVLLTNNLVAAVLGVKNSEEGDD